ncbi:phage shock protein C (PspC) family protein [Sphingomonas laterariae]|uniref:Phage shock protein C (PspC) family protein n=1 Tax=Edaphosphingomonas laterariae TaxID=861865 RepID=A0A239D3Z4_9SPHN|nr:PspC domain-containing protein [Sphingomonas laterariae]SNS26564.1 phage shock protein C (PspC) family protein [Sphingomonas laterariae]
MHASPSVPARKESLFGVCAALGEDFGFNPLYLRIGLGVLMLWNPVAVVAGYFAVGVVALLTRIIFPNPKLAAVPEAAAVAPPILIAPSEESIEMPLAA